MSVIWLTYYPKASNGVTNVTVMNKVTQDIYRMMKAYAIEPTYQC